MSILGSAWLFDSKFDCERVSVPEVYSSIGITCDNNSLPSFDLDIRTRIFQC